MLLASLNEGHSLRHVGPETTAQVIQRQDPHPKVGAMPPFAAEVTRCLEDCPRQRPYIFVILLQGWDLAPLTLNKTHCRGLFAC